MADELFDAASCSAHCAVRSRPFTWDERRQLSVEISNLAPPDLPGVRYRTRHRFVHLLPLVPSLSNITMTTQTHGRRSVTPHGQELVHRKDLMRVLVRFQKLSGSFLLQSITRTSEPQPSTCWLAKMTVLSAVCDMCDSDHEPAIETCRLQPAAAPRTRAASSRRPRS